MKQHHAFQKNFSAHLFVLKLAWKINKKRVILETLDCAFYYIEWLLYSGVIVQAVMDLVTQNISYSRIMFFIWGVQVPVILMGAFSHWFQEYIKPVSDVELYEGIHQLLYQKACQVDLSCFEDSEFYNRYMMATKEAQTRLPKALHNIMAITVGMCAAVAAFLLVFRIDRMAIVFILFPILGNFLFNGILNSRIFQMDRESMVFRRIADYVNRTVHLADYAKEMRISNIFRLMKQQYIHSVDMTHKVIDRYAFKNMVYFWLFQYFTFTLLFEGSMMYAGYRVLVSGTMTFPQMTVFQSIMHANTWIILYFSEGIMESVKDSLYIEQIQDFLNYQPRIPEDSQGVLPDTCIKSIEFSHVWFSYQSKKENQILKDISFRIEAGKSTAIVGYNGAGKSTLIKLLLRLYDPDKGTILVNGIDIRSYNLKAYRQLFSAAFQDGKIFADTVSENILMGVHRGTEEDTQIVWNALRLAGMEKEVASWPQKEQTLLTREFSQEGHVPSGGQNQKIIAARAFAKNSPIAVFDEPSSALDPIAETELFRSILEYGRGKILFFISHRLSSVQNADTVFFMENGRITETGNHRELMGQNGNYAKLYRIQARNYNASPEEIQDSSDRKGETL
ncbi:MAG: ABC transporter ATP-binding protein/permease [Lachnospiraceae bacterium]|nr:ABC transporter ATP-binding protein/permease [Lachnospiraceae bacterium]